MSNHLKTELNNTLKVPPHPLSRLQNGLESPQIVAVANKCRHFKTRPGSEPVEFLTKYMNCHPANGLVSLSVEPKRVGINDLQRRGFWLLFAGTKSNKAACNANQSI